MNGESRRSFIKKSAFAGLATLGAAHMPFPLWAEAGPKARWGVAIITWKDDYTKAFEEIASLGVKGIQVRGNVFEAYRAKPKELKAKLKSLGLKAPILSGGNIPADLGNQAQTLEKFLAMADFVSAIGGDFLQVTTQGRDAYPPGKDKLLAIAQSINLLGEKTKEKGVRLLLHNHMHQICQSPEETDTILSATDPRYCGLLLDIAHYAQAGGNPADAIRKYKKRLELLHIKDLLAPKPGHTGKKDHNYQFVELGKGNKIDIPGVLAALADIRFKGWCMIELDEVPRPDSQALDCTRTSLDYLKARFDPRF